MGALVTLEVPADSPVVSLPWIITIGPLAEDDQWEAVVCGPYERAHALALAEEVVADEDLMAVVEPVLPHVSVDAIRAEVANARALAAEEAAAEDDDDADSDALLDDADDADLDDDDLADDDLAEDELAADELDDEDGDVAGEDDEAGYAEHAGYEDEDGERPVTPGPDEVRAGFARIAQRLTDPPEHWPSA